MSAPQGSRFDEALRLASLGHRVLALQPDKKAPRPCTRGVHDATGDVATIRSWWMQEPSSNVGLALGGMLVVDIDDRDTRWPGDIERAAELQAAAGAIAETPRGVHLIFRAPEGIEPRSNAGVFAPGVDVRAGAGSYIVVAPSEVGGKPYRWRTGCSLDEPPDRLPRPPAWLVEQLAKSSRPSASPTQHNGRASPGTISEGKRNVTLTSIAGSLRMLGHSADGVEAALRVANLERCAPPLDDVEIRRIAHSVARYKPDERAARAVEAIDAGPMRGAGEPDIVRMEDVAPEEIRWLWPSRIPAGKLTIIAGDPGLGKSYAVLDVIARVSAGAPWPDSPGSHAPQGGAVILTCEDGLGDTIRPRLDALSADCSRVVAMRGVHRGDGKVSHFTLDDVEPLRKAIKEVNGCKAVMIDAISGYLGATDSHNNAETRAVLANLAALAEETGVSIIGISHLSKSGAHVKRSAYRVMGSLAFVAAPRAVWAVGQDPDDPDRRILANVKMNVAKTAPSWAYRIDSRGLHWESAACDLDCDTLLNGEKAGDTERPAREDAAGFLIEELANGPVPTKELLKRGRDAGHSEKTLRRAKGALGVVARKEGMEGGWMWLLPGARIRHAGGEDREDGQRVLAHT